MKIVELFESLFDQEVQHRPKNQLDIAAVAKIVCRERQNVQGFRSSEIGVSMSAAERSHE